MRMSPSPLVPSVLRSFGEGGCIEGCILKLIVAILLFCSPFSARAADLIIFSYDRPLQLYAFLESVQRYVTGIGQTSIIYRTSGQDFDAGYQIVQSTFP